MPEPIAILDLDQNIGHLLEEFNDKAIAHFPIKIPLLFSQSGSAKVWNDFYEKFLALVQNPDVRSIMIDNNSDVWAHLRMGTFGKLDKIMPDRYAEINLPMHQMLQSVKSTDKNLYIVHRWKEIYRETQTNNRKGDTVRLSEPTGEFRLEGYKNTSAIAQVNCIHSYNGSGFVLKIDNCHQNMELAGVELANDEIDWTTLGQMVYPYTTAEDWK